MNERLVIDGSYGEGGGQVLRSTLTLSAITGRPVRIENIRSARRNPGLAAQHLTAVHAAAALCGADLKGDALGSTCVEFLPRHPVRPGHYSLDVSEARVGGSAGAVTLVLQTILLPLALGGTDSDLALRGGTHVQASPSFDYIHDVWLPALADMGVSADLELLRSGWYPAGRGEVHALVRGLGAGGRRELKPFRAVERGRLRRIWGRAIAANLPAHIPQRMADRARSLLADVGLAADVEAVRVSAACAGAGIFLAAQFDRCRAGFAALGARGKPSEVVAQEACAALLEHRDSGAALDEHLADQLVLPAALAPGESAFSVQRVSRHLLTSAWLVESFGLARLQVDGGMGRKGIVTVSGRLARAP
jgi:RNA 3'-terminal phosphate cyclase (ATP)